EAVSIAFQDVLVAAEDHQHVKQEVAEIAGVQRPQALLILGIEIGPATGRETLGLAGVDLARSPSAVFPTVDQGGELPGGPALLIEIRRLDQLFEDPQLVVGVEDRE